MTIPPFAIGVCSWSLQVHSAPELRLLLDELGINVVQIACGDPHHAAWQEGDDFPRVARAAGFEMTSAMLGFPGEDYTTPATIRQTGGFGDPALRAARIERLQWGLQRTRELGLDALTLHAGFIPAVGDPARKGMLDTLARVGELAGAAGVIVAFETGQESAALLRQTLDDLRCSHLKVNFDPANMLLYDMGDPLEAVETLGPDIYSVHAKDGLRPTAPGTWGQEVPLGHGQVGFGNFLKVLQKVGYRGPLCIEREVGNQRQRVADVAYGIRFLRLCLAEA
jgi:L-ribulose-5-phosphate 3-epimerase